MTASLYKDSTLLASGGVYTSRFIKFVRWLLGETTGDLNTFGPGGGGANIRVIEAWETSGNRSVPNYGGWFEVVDNSLVSPGDTVTIEDVDGAATQVYTAVASGAGAGQFNIGANAAATASNLVASINATPVGSSDAAIALGKGILENRISFNAGTATGTQWNLSTSNAAGIAVSGATTVSGSLDGLASTMEWREARNNFTNGWIVIEFDGTGVNGNVGWQWFQQFNGGSAGDMDDNNVVIPAKDWVAKGGTVGAVLNSQALIAAETTSGLCTEPGNGSANAPFTTQMIWYGWADAGMVCVIGDDTTSGGDIFAWYAGEVDDAPAGDTRPFVASNGNVSSPNFAFVGSGANSAWSRISPIDGLTLLNDARNVTFCQNTDNSPWLGTVSYSDFGGYYRSPIGVGFITGGHAHVAGTLRYVNVTNSDTGARWTSDGLTRIGWAVGDSGIVVQGAWSLPWDGTTPHP